MFERLAIRPYGTTATCRKERAASCIPGPMYYRPLNRTPRRIGDYYDDGRGYYTSDNIGTPDAAPGNALFALRAVARPLNVSYFSDDDGSTNYYPVVLMLPRGRGFLAGWTMGEGMCASIGYRVFAEVKDAWYDAEQEAAAARDSEADDRATMNAAHDAGERKGRAGATAADNPHAKGSELRDEWANGWDDGAEELSRAIARRAEGV